jgi:hypothetical protein
MAGKRVAIEFNFSIHLKLLGKVFEKNGEEKITGI